jgi:hypothetical protein
MTRREILEHLGLPVSSVDQSRRFREHPLTDICTTRNAVREPDEPIDATSRWRVCCTTVRRPAFLLSGMEVV